jgi:hypothetical protein
MLRLVGAVAMVASVGSGFGLAAEVWTLELQPASVVAAPYVKIWIGLRNSAPQAHAVCVKSATLRAEGATIFVVPSITHSCTTDREVHLVLPGETYWVLGNSTALDPKTRLSVSVDLVSWHPTEEVTTEQRLSSEPHRESRRAVSVSQATATSA